MNADKLIAFRQTAYGCLGRAYDALFELGDAVLSSPRVNSFAFKTRPRAPILLNHLSFAIKLAAISITYRSV